MNSDAIENPSERTFGGIASDSDAKMPGARSAESPEMTMFDATATQSHGASAKVIQAPAMPMARIESSFSPRPGSFSISRDASGMPRMMPTICAGSAIAPTKPAAGFVEPEHFLVIEVRQRCEADDRRGEERQREPDAPEGAHLPQDADRLRPRGRRFVGVDDRLFGARRAAFEVPASGLLQAHAEDHEHDRREEEDDERDAPVGVVRDERRRLRGR